MESLLRWGIENSARNADEQHQEQPVQPRKDLDPAIIDQILGKPDAELMKEALAIAVDENRDEDERVQALDDFEMLVEHIDNANDLEKLKMWEPLQNLLTSPSSADEIQRQVLWIIGTAVQNNPSAQVSYLVLSPLPTLLSFLLPSVESAQTRSKAVYALSGLLKHNAAAVRQLEDSHGWEVLRNALEDSDITVRRKVAFLLNTLLVPTASVVVNSQGQDSTVSAPPPSTGSSSSTAVMLHPTAPHSAPAPAPTTNIVHPNSHASMLSDPNFSSTSAITQEALEKHAILPALIQSLVSPTPFGPDGDIDDDADFEEKVINTLNTYLISCKGQLHPDQKTALGTYLQQESEKSGGDAKLSQEWGIDVTSLRQAVG